MGVPLLWRADGGTVNARIVNNVRDQLRRIRHLSTVALSAEVRTLVAQLPPDEREFLRTVARVVHRAIVEGAQS